MAGSSLSYLVARVARHFMPERLTRFLLLRSIVIRAGLETSDPQAAVQRYMDVLSARRETIAGKRVLLFGYGGRFDVGLGLLAAGAGHVVLCEKYAPPDDSHNSGLVSKYGQYLRLEQGHPRPHPGGMTLLQADVRDLHQSADLPACDYVFSSSVYEHVEDIDGITCALAGLTKPDGLQVHFVDLRDHFFKYPFEMLTFSEGTWRNWLNPTSNHNRLRLWDFRDIFKKYFEEVAIEVLARDEAAFKQVSSRIRPEFQSGRPQDDSVTLIRVVAGKPRPQPTP
jgi:hypothetical protein